VQKKAIIMAPHFSRLESDDEEDALAFMIMNMGLLSAIIALDSEESPPIEKKGNKHRDRRGCLRKIDDLDDKTFQRMFRLSREAFDDVLNKIRPDIENDEMQEKMAEISSGSGVDARLKLCIALRLAAGGSYLDIA